MGKTKKKQKEVIQEVQDVPTMSIEQFIAEQRPYVIPLGAITDKSYANFIHHVNDTNDILRRQVILDSPGGNATLINSIIHTVENNHLELVASSTIASAAFVIFFKSDVEKIVLDNTMGLFHYTWYNGASVGPDFKMVIDEESEKFFIEKGFCDEEFFKELLEIDKKKHKMLLKGGELLYNSEQLRELIVKADKLLGNG